MHSIIDQINEIWNKNYGKTWKSQNNQSVHVGQGNKIEIVIAVQVLIFLKFLSIHRAMRRFTLLTSEYRYMTLPF